MTLPLATQWVPEIFLNLIFVTDPLCPWCYAFGHFLLGIADSYPDLPVSLVVGGLRTQKLAPLNVEQKRYELAKWDRVQKLSGLSFNRESFVASKFDNNTELMCRAVVVIRQLAPVSDHLLIFCKLKEAFYVLGRDISNGRKIARVAAGVLAEVNITISPTEFYNRWREADTIAETQRDFEKVKDWNINKFPVLMLESNQQVHSVAFGFITIHDLHRNLKLALRQFGYADSSKQLREKLI